MPKTQVFETDASLSSYIPTSPDIETPSIPREQIFRATTSLMWPPKENIFRNDLLLLTLCDFSGENSV